MERSAPGPLANDGVRRAIFLEKLHAGLEEPAFRATEGFPVGEDADILSLSDPPYYTACPNPFVEDLVGGWCTCPSPIGVGAGTDGSGVADDHQRAPFAADVSEGKGDPIYSAHSYHTKVPHKAIMRYILHYTKPGDIVFDGFCGTGMVGVAARLCGNAEDVASLGYKVLPDDAVLDREGKLFSKLGPRRAVLSDLSPVAAFIAYNYNTPVDVADFEREARRILAEVEEECGWMYQTLHRPRAEGVERRTSPTRGRPHPNPLPEGEGMGKSALPEGEGMGKSALPEGEGTGRVGRINYTVWSDVFVCPACREEVVFWEAAVDKSTDKVRATFPCPHCGVTLAKRLLKRAWVAVFDAVTNQTLRQAKQAPVLISYSVGGQRFEKRPDPFDLALIKTIDNSRIPYWFPTDRMPEGSEARRNDAAGITHVHHFYTKRNLWTLSALLARTRGVRQPRTAKMCRFMFEQWAFGFSRLNRYSPRHFSQNNRNLSGTLYVGALVAEVSPDYAFPRKLKRLVKAFATVNTETPQTGFDQQPLAPRHAVITVQSSTATHIPANSVDYIFTDPPFGGNLMYSQLNFIWEAWLKVFTNQRPEAVQSRAQGKGLVEYRELMTRCFREFHRVLKPGRWLTVEFHNSRNSVWNAIHEALRRAGFVIADVRTLDKGLGTFKQVNLAGAVKQDLIISAYKPAGIQDRPADLALGVEEGVWEFVSARLKQLPVCATKDGQPEVIVERLSHLLFDRMVAFHLQRGIAVPISAAEFYAGLKQRFVERDGMYFLPSTG